MIRGTRTARTYETSAFSAYRASRRPLDFEFVYKQTAPRLYRLARKQGATHHDAEELVQSTLLVSLDHAETFDNSQELFGWLCGILLNHLRSERRRELRLSRARQELSSDPSPDEVMEVREQRDCLRSALDSLVEKYREVLALRFFEGMRVVDIAHRLDRSPSTVATQLQRGLEEFRGRSGVEELRV